MVEFLNNLSVLWIDMSEEQKQVVAKVISGK